MEEIERAIEKVAHFNKTEIVKEHAWSFNPFTDKYRYFDKFNREYKAKVEKKGIVVKVIPPKIEKKLNLLDTDKFIVRDEEVYRIINRKIILGYIKNFLQERGYEITFAIEKKGKIQVKGRNTVKFFENQQYGEIEITKKINFWEVKIRDENREKPYFCSPNFQIILKLKREIKENQDMLIEYEEGEITSTSISPFAIIRRAIYGFKSPNLRAFYSEEGLLPEIKHAVRLNVFAYFSTAIVNASVFVRVAEKLKGNTWYTLAVGLLAFVRAPAEIFYMRKSLKLTQHLPSAKVQKIIDSGNFKKMIERKEIRVWRNFERKLFDLLRKKGFTNFANGYGKIKEDIYNYVEKGEKENIISLFEVFNLTEDEKKQIAYFVNLLVPIDIEHFKEMVLEEVKNLCKQGILKENSDVVIKEYMNSIFVYNLKRFTFNKSYKLLLDKIKQEERPPTKEEISSLIYGCKRGTIPYRIFDFFLFFSLYIIGYLASYYAGLPNLAIPIYYVFYGMSANIIAAAINRYASQVNLQFIYRELDSAPIITSAADAWSEYNSHLMRIYAVFSSLGLALGITGKLLSSKTGGFSRYFVEGIAFFMYIQAFKEWFLFYNKLERKSKKEEE